MDLEIHHVRKLKNLKGKAAWDDTVGDGEHTVGALGGVVALEGQAQLEDAEAKQDQADGPMG